jgi:hypothetical protein
VLQLGQLELLEPQLLLLLLAQLGPERPLEGRLEPQGQLELPAPQAQLVPVVPLVRREPLAQLEPQARPGPPEDEPRLHCLLKNCLL